MTEEIKEPPRVSVALSAQAERDLEELERYERRRRGDLINSAIVTYAALLREGRNGSKIVVVNPITGEKAEMRFY